MATIFTLEGKLFPFILMFEGFFDYESGWEFDMPIHMVKPVYRTGEGGSLGEVEQMVETFMIDLDLDGSVKEEPIHEGLRFPYRERTAMSYFYRSRKGKARKGIKYWWQAVLVEGRNAEGELVWDYLEGLFPYDCDDTCKAYPDWVMDLARKRLKEEQRKHFDSLVERAKCDREFSKY